MRHASSNSTVEIPEQFDSPQTLVFLGFIPDRVGQLRQGWQEMQRSGRKIPFLDAILEYLKHRYPDAIKEEDDWEAYFTQLGLAEAFKRRLMDADFKEWRLSGSAAHWTCEMTTMSYQFLESLDVCRHTVLGIYSLPYFRFWSSFSNSIDRGR